MVEAYSEGEVFLIFDCCFAAKSVAGHHTGPEILAASSWDSIASADKQYCLTGVLNSTLV
jgi:hypothetical protein